MTFYSLKNLFALQDLLFSTLKYIYKSYWQDWPLLIRHDSF